MNYALDALWWRLSTPIVRDLAGILTAPSLWGNQLQITSKQLLGEKGFRFLLQLDREPEPLLAYLNPIQQRLGKYAEQLLAFWLSHAPHCRLLAHDLPVLDKQGRTLGALDFVADIEGKCCHIELACKFYGCADGQSHNMVGLNRHDRWQDKAHKLVQQMALGQSEEARAALQQMGIDADGMLSYALVRGMVFTRDVPPDKAFATDAWCGTWVQNWADFELDGQQMFYVLPRLSYLAAARVSSEQIVAFQDIRYVSQGLLALVEQRPDGYWHEVCRVMKVAEDETTAA